MLYSGRYIFIIMDLLLQNKNETKHAVSLIGFGFCLDVIGALLKMLHHTGEDITLIIAAIIKVMGALMFLYKLTNYPKVKEFMES